MENKYGVDKAMVYLLYGAVLQVVVSSKNDAVCKSCRKVHSFVKKRKSRCIKSDGFAGFFITVRTYLNASQLFKDETECFSGFLGKTRIFFMKYSLTPKQICIKIHQETRKINSGHCK